MKPRYQTTETDSRPSGGSHRSDAAADHEKESGGRGRDADKPSEIPKRGWKDILWRTKEEMKDDNLSIISAGVAFYIFFGSIPALAAVVAIYGLVADPETIQQQINALGGVLPPDITEILTEQLTRISEQSTGATWGAMLGILLTLWSGSKATKAVIMALNITYDEDETRGFIRLNLTALGLTLVGIIAVIITVSFIVAIPIILRTVGGGGIAETAVNVLRWPLLAAFGMFGLAAVYRYAPDRETAEWRWVTWGAGIAMAIWVVASAGFSYYVSSFGNYNNTYGSLGVVAVLMLWFLITAYVTLLGAELDAEMEHQTAEDTTTGKEERLGQRGAHVADNVGPARKENNWARKTGS